MGKVTSALARLDVGDVIGLRGPYGKGFPYRSFAGRDVLVVGSGVGLAPVRTIIVRLLQERERYGRIAIIASATRYEGLVYKQDPKDWSRIPGVTVQYALARPTDAVRPMWATSMTCCRNWISTGPMPGHPVCFAAPHQAGGP